MVLGHRSGVIGPRTRLTPEQAANWDEVCEHIARATPWWEPGTAQGYHMATFGFILGEVVRRTTGKTLGQFLRTEIAEPYGLDVHVGLPHSEHHRCAELINKPYLRDVFRGAPGEFDCMSDHPLAGPLISGDFIPDDEIARKDIALWRALEFPGTNAHVSALGMATFYNAMALGKLLSHEHMDVVRVSQGDSIPMWCWVPGWPTTDGVWATCSTSAATPGPTRRRSGMAGPVGPMPSSIWSTASATRM